MAEVGRAHVLGEQPIERAFVHLEELDLVQGANGCLATMGAEEAHLAERLAPGHRPEDAVSPVSESSSSICTDPVRTT